MHYRKVSIAIVTTLVVVFALLHFFPEGAAHNHSPLAREEVESVLLDSGWSGRGRPAQGRIESDGTRKPDAPPKKVSLCELKKDPAVYNHKLIEVAAFVSHGFEDFTLFDPACSAWPEVWLEYGGTSKSGTMYCCGVTADRSRPQPLIVENISVPLIDDAQFREFDRLLQRRSDSVVRATVVGRFFAGEQMKYPRGTFWGGYGHMGCCSLLAIQQITSVDKQERADLDYGATPDAPDLNEACA